RQPGAAGRSGERARAGAARRGRARVPGAGDAHLGPRRAHAPGRCRQHRSTADAGVTEADATGAPGVTTCPQCGQPVAVTDQFCEACGSPLGVPAEVGAATGEGPEPPETSTTHPAGAPLPPRCSCGGEIDADGFCTTCGLRAPS